MGSEIIVFASKYVIEGWVKILTNINKNVPIIAVISDDRRMIETKTNLILSEKKKNSKNNLTGYFIFENYDTSGRVDVGYLLMSIVTKLLPLVDVINVLAPGISEGRMTKCRKALNDSGFSEVVIIDPLEEELFKETINSIPLGCLY